MRKNKINRATIMAALNTTYPSCGYSIPPPEIQRVSSAQMKCPAVWECVCGWEEGEGVLKATEAMKLSSEGIARRYDADGYAWLVKGGKAFRRVPEMTSDGDFRSHDVCSV